MRYFLLLAFLTLLASPLHAQDSISKDSTYICVKCGKPILRQAAVIDGQLFHPDCFRCQACGEPIRDEFLKGTDGNYYHRACLERLQQVHCGYCGLPIKDGKYTTYQGKPYHDNCFLNHVAPRCEICGKPLGESYITDYWGNQFHPEHAKEFPVCAVCGRIIWQGGHQLDDVRMLCPTCFEVSVSDQERARGLLEEVREELARIGIVVKTLGVRIQLVSKADLVAGRAQSGLAHTYAQVVWDRRSARPGDETASIKALTGLPEDMLRGVIAHELMHVWQHENGADNLEPDIREGSANWASSLIYTRLATKRGQFFVSGLEKSPDPIYGVGYRKVAKIGDREGVEGVLKMLKGEEGE